MGEIEWLVFEMRFVRKVHSAQRVCACALPGLLLDRGPGWYRGDFSKVLLAGIELSTPRVHATITKRRCLMPARMSRSLCAALLESWLPDTPGPPCEVIPREHRS